jgi:hypothetical protein
MIMGLSCLSIHVKKFSFQFHKWYNPMLYIFSMSGVRMWTVMRAA